MARKWLIRLGFGLLCLGVLYFISLLIIGRVADGRIEAELAAIREKGEPLLLTEMAPSPVPDEQNAAGPLLKASKLLGEESEEESEAIENLHEAPLGCTDQEAEIARGWLDRQQAALEAIEEALVLPDCRFDYDYSSALGLLEESDFGAFDFIQCAGLLTLRGSLAVREGNLAAAYDDVLGTLRLAAFASSDPMLLHAMVRSSCEMRALVLLNAALRQEAPDDERREKLLAALDSIDTRGYLGHAMQGERCFGHSMFLMFPENRDMASITGAVSFAEGEFVALLTYLSPAVLIRLDQAHYLKLMSKMIDLQKRPAYETREDWQALDRELSDPPWYAFLSNLSLVSLGDISRTVETHRARLDLARIALDLEHALKVTGQLPNAILIPGTEGHRGSIDPFSGRDYRFKATEEGGYVLWSVGPNLTDDNGVDGEEDSYDSGDIVWER